MAQVLPGKTFNIRNCISLDQRGADLTWDDNYDTDSASGQTPFVHQKTRLTIIYSGLYIEFVSSEIANEFFENADFSTVLHETKLYRATKTVNRYVLGSNQFLFSLFHLLLRLMKSVKRLSVDSKRLEIRFFVVFVMC